MDPGEGRALNILIVKLSAIGDVVHTLPSLAALRQCYPGAHITWVVEEAAADLLAGHPALDRVIVSRRKSWLDQLRKGQIASPVQGLRDFLRELRERHYDLVIDFHGLLKSAVIVAASGGRRRLGYDSLQELSGLFYNEKIHEDMGKHAVDRYLDFVHHLRRGSGDRETVPERPPEFTLTIGEKERLNAAALLKRHAGTLGMEIQSGETRTVGAFVAINPVALWETKLWDDGRFAELGDRIRRELGISVVITGSDAEPIERITRRMETRAVNLGGQTSLRELACLYRQAALLVTTDSGPMHLAAAVGTPVIALFGPTDPVRTGPYGPGHRIIRGEMPCIPCFRKRCETGDCMRAITVETVFSAVKEILNERNLLQGMGTGQRPAKGGKGVVDGNQ